MDSPAPISEDRITIQSELLYSSSGLALDIGGSTAKILYRPKAISKDDSEGHKSASGTLHTAMFAADKIDDIIKFVSSKCDLKTDTNGNITVNATGIGCNVFKAKLEKELGIRIKVLDEFDCFVNALKHLLKVTPWDQLVHPPSKAAQSAGEKIAKSYKEWAEKLGMQTDSPPTEEKHGEIPQKLPALLAICGSATVLILVNKDGSHRIIDGINAGGRFFLGAANGLVGKTDYQSLLTMASKGDGRSVDTYYSDLLQDKAGEGVYNVQDNDKLVYPFGKVSLLDTGEIDKNDMVHSLSNVIGTVHAQVIQLNALVHKVMNVYFCGNYFNTEQARGAVESLHVVRSYLTPGDKKIGFHFLRHGGVYGALGAYLHAEPAPEEGATGTSPGTAQPVVQSTHF